MRMEQVISFSHQDLIEMALEKAKAQIKNETGKDPTGSSSVKFYHKEEGDESSPGVGAKEKSEYRCTVTFQSNGPKGGRP